jgi:two-component system sensor histidine kinase DegS
MSDNNKKKESMYLGLDDKRNSALEFLYQMADEFKVQLNTNLRLKKENDELLLQKEQERIELERSKPNNIDLFSPFYSREYDTTQITIEIDSIRQKQKQLQFTIETLNEKLMNITNTTQFIDLMINDSQTEKSQDECNLFINMIDNGIGLLEAQEKERQRIARELHDSTVQNLTTLVHKTEFCLKLIDMDIIRARLELSAMSGKIKNIINDMRDIIYNLKPMSLDDLGLIVTVERYARQIMESHELQIKINHNKEIKGILPVVNLTLFRIIQEACCNTIKHAKATAINIKIDYREHDIAVTIKDNGIGFDPEMQKKKVSDNSSSFGLSIMKERTALLSGTLKIQSESGKGTIVTVIVPITKCEGEKNE